MQQYTITTMFDDDVLPGTYFLFLMFVWCPCMAMNVSVQYNGGLVPDITLLTLFESLSRTVTCTGELSALISVIPRGKELIPPCLDYRTW